MIDKYFPKAYFTTDADDFKRRMVTDRVDYLTVCTPNSFHCTHTIMGLEAGADVICEKPLSLTSEDLLRMDECQRAAGRHVRPILQLRLHPEIEGLKKLVENSRPDAIYDIDPCLYYSQRQLVCRVMERRSAQERRLGGKYRHSFYRYAALDIRPGGGGGRTSFVF